MSLFGVHISRDQRTCVFQTKILCKLFQSTKPHIFQNILFMIVIWKEKQDLPDGPVVKNLPANTGQVGSTSGPRRSHMQRAS